MTSQANAVTSQVKAMTSQVNREVGPQVPQQVTIVASRLRDYTKICPATFFGLRSDEDPQDLLDEVYKII